MLLRAVKRHRPDTGGAAGAYGAGQKHDNAPDEMTGLGRELASSRQLGTLRDGLIDCVALPTNRVNSGTGAEF
ncbi:hypothetical protein OHV05_22375 [Kitasatospora sp. NBC_00070]|uniref:hypothetical protein n=1 Tax=Kitasatospora sp. NBC_00070 TaxID=2975962 RepID=UPI00325527AD